jgi:hypothetical protein
VLIEERAQIEVFGERGREYLPHSGDEAVVTEGSSELVEGVENARVIGGSGLRRGWLGLPAATDSSNYFEPSRAHSKYGTFRAVVTAP